MKNFKNIALCTVTHLLIVLLFMSLTIALLFLSHTEAMKMRNPAKSRSVFQTIKTTPCGDYRLRFQNNQVKKCEIQKRNSARNTFEQKSNILVHPVRRR